MLFVTGNISLAQIFSLDFKNHFSTQAFLYLRELDLSYNNITDVEDFPYKLGNITMLNLAGNHLKDVKGMFGNYTPTTRSILIE